MAAAAAGPSRPLSNAELLDGAVELVRRAPVTLYAVSLVGTLPFALLGFLYARSLAVPASTTDAAVRTGALWQWALAATAAWAWLALTRGVLTVLLLGMGSSAPVATGEAWRRALRGAVPCVLCGVGSLGLGAAAGMWLVLPGLWVLSAGWAARPAALAEGLGFVGAVSRSLALTRGARLRLQQLWLLIVLVSAVLLLNLFLLARAAPAAIGDVFGVDMGRIEPWTARPNPALGAVLCILILVLLDPVKAALDALLYLDLRVRREGADIQIRIRRFGQASAAQLAHAFLAVVMFGCSVWGAGRWVAGGGVGAEACGGLVRRILATTALPPTGSVRVPICQFLSPGATRPVLLAPRAALAAPRAEGGADGGPPLPTPRSATARATALERATRGLNRTTRTRTAPPVDPGPVLQRLLTSPEFRPLAAPPSLRPLVSPVRPPDTRSWFDSAARWLRQTFSHIRWPRWNWRMPTWRWPWSLPGPVPAPQPGDESRVLGVNVVQLLLALLVLLLLGVVAGLFMPWMRGLRRMTRPAVAPSAPAPEAGDNALARPVGDREALALQQLHGGEPRAALRAMYLALLVHLHQQRWIEYDRSRTNRSFVREFRGGAEQKNRFASLTDLFEQVWYGDRECSIALYEEMVRGAMALGAPVQVHEAPHA